ncbi:MAG: DUF2341 domain-containing protein [Methanobacteriota archaeon]
MGFSLSAAFTILAVTVILIIELLAGALVPSITQYIESWDNLKDRRVAVLQSQINITDVIDGVTGTWWNESFGFRKSIRIDETKVMGEVSNFPVLIDITDIDLKVHVLQSNGNDVAFVNILHTMKYNHEIELYESSTGHLIAWVNVTSLSSEEITIFYIYYGNSSCASQQNPLGVWDGQFHGVWHLEESSGTLSESTSYGNDGTAYNNPTYGATGKIATALYFDGTNDYVDCGDPVDGSLDFGTNDFTIECWVKTSTTLSRYIMSKLVRNPLTGSGTGYALEIYHQMNTSLGDGTVYNIGPSVKTINDNNWHHLVIVFDRNDWGVVLYYIDGEFDEWYDIGGIGNIDTTDSFQLCRKLIQAGPPKYNYFAGTIDEVRVSKGLRSEDWVNTSFQNQNSPSIFYTLGSETTIFLTIMVENTGGIVLNTDKFCLLVNGTNYDVTCNRTLFFPLYEYRFCTISQITSGPKQIKMIADTSAEDKYMYTG